MLTDAELVDGVVAGYDDAFAQLYERHSLAAWRLGQTVTGNAEDAADAVSEAFARVLVAVRAGHLDNGSSFRSYLLTATRNAALDNIRKTCRSRPTENETLAELESGSPSPSERLTGDEEAALVAEAFRNLPERWRSVLWLTEIEGVATKEAAHRLGLSPNGAAQLAVRARAGLRERFLQAHLRKAAEPQCRTTVDRLGAYVGGGLAPRDLAKVDQHLAGCASCQARKNELEDVGTLLRRVATPVPLALGAALGAASVPAVVGVGGRVAKALAWAQQGWAQAAAAAAAAGVLVAGAGGAYVAGSGAERAEREAQAVVVSAEPAPSADRAMVPGMAIPDANVVGPDAPPAPPPSTADADGVVPAVAEEPCGGLPGVPGAGASSVAGADGSPGSAAPALDAGAAPPGSTVAGGEASAAPSGGGLARVVPKPPGAGNPGTPGARPSPAGTRLEVALGDLQASAVLSHEGGPGGGVGLGLEAGEAGVSFGSASGAGCDPGTGVELGAGDHGRVGVGVPPVTPGS